MRNAIDIVGVAHNGVTLQHLHQLILDAPSSPSEARSKEWAEHSFLVTCLEKAEAEIEAGRVSQKRHHDFAKAVQYFTKEYPGLSEKTRSIIVSSFTSMADVLTRGEMHNLFCTGTNVFPEMSRHGHVLVLDLPIKKWGHTGRIAQLIFKYVWQKAMERGLSQDIKRPVFLWADEAQFFMSPYDMEFQTTVRSSKVSTVYLTQNLENYYAAIQEETRVKSILSNLNTKIFHANSDATTNEWASGMIAKSMQDNISHSNSDKEKSGISTNFSQELRSDVEPQEFTRMRGGTDRNNKMVDAILFQSGRIFSNGKTYLRIQFFQEQ